MQDNYKIEIGIYSENENKNIKPTSFTFSDLDEMGAYLNFEMSKYSDDPCLLVRISEGEKPYLLHFNSQFALNEFINEVRNHYNLLEQNATKNSNYYFDENKETRYLKTSEGKNLPYKIFQGNDYEEGSYLLREKENKRGSNNFALIERQFSENKNLSFLGSTKIKNADDVAWLFRSLEDEAIEHAFALYKFKDGSYFIQHLSTGGITSAIIDMRLISGIAHKLKPESITIIHNHPSGKLVASESDRKILKKLNTIFQHSNIKIEDGIIINLRSGKYLVFKAESESETISFINNTSNKKNIPVYSFNKQFFLQNYQPYKINSPADVAAYISTQKFGISDKTEALILNQGNEVIGKFILPQHRQLEKLTQILTDFGGTGVILYGNNITPELFENYNKILKNSDFETLDAMYIKSNNLHSCLQDEPIIKNYISTEMNYESYTELIPEERRGEAFHIKVTKEEAEYLILNEIVYDIMNKEYGEDDEWVGMNRYDLDEETQKFDDDYQTFEIDVTGETETNIKAILHEIEKFVNSKYFDNYLNIQRSQLNEWKSILKPQVYSMLEKSILESNEGITKPSDIKRGVSIEMELHNNIKNSYQTQQDKIIDGVRVKVVIQSHLSDALHEIQTGLPELSQQAINRISFVKNLLMNNPDLTAYISETELNQLWEKENTDFINQYDLNHTHINKNSNIMEEPTPEDNKKYNLFLDELIFPSNSEDIYSHYYYLNDADKAFFLDKKNLHNVTDAIKKYILNLNNYNEIEIESLKNDALNLLTELREEVNKNSLGINSERMSSSLYNENAMYSPATTLPGGWEWQSYSDKSGSLLSPERKNYFQFDLETREYKDPFKKGEWSEIPDDFYEYAESMILSHGLNENGHRMGSLNPPLSQKEKEQLINNKNTNIMESTAENQKKELKVGQMASVQHDGQLFKGTVESIDVKTNRVQLMDKVNNKGINTNIDQVYGFFPGQKYDIAEIKPLFVKKPGGIDFESLSKEDVTQLLKGQLNKNLLQGISSKDGVEKTYQLKVRPEYNSETKQLQLQPYFKNNGFDLDKHGVFGIKISDEQIADLKAGKSIEITRVSKQGNDFTAKYHYDADLNQVLFDKFVKDKPMPFSKAQEQKEKFTPEQKEAYLLEKVEIWDNATKINLLQLNKMCLVLDGNELEEFLTDLGIEENSINAICSNPDPIDQNSEITNIKKESVLETINSSAEKIGIFKDAFKNFGQQITSGIKK